ncbi:MAG: hypothetical protein WC565_05300 [Parcubacteria group bacterium]|jgi:hypothetical protein
MILDRIENAFLLAYALDDQKKVETVRGLRDRFLTDRAAYEGSKITREAFQATEIDVSRALHALFSTSAR